MTADPYDLERFVRAQAADYDRAISELVLVHPPLRYSIAQNVILVVRDSIQPARDSR